MSNLKPCPFCGSNNLRAIEITLAHDDGDEDVSAIECLDCDAKARADRWSGRTDGNETTRQIVAAADELVAALESFVPVDARPLIDAYHAACGDGGSNV